jgi:hypothetical protein
MDLQAEGLQHGRQRQGGGNSTVESHSSKVMVAGSNPVPRSNDLGIGRKN